MKLSLNNSGLTLIEILLVSIFVIGAVNLAGRVLSQQQTFISRQLQKNKVVAGMFQLVGMINRVGRMASSCQLETEQELRCFVDKSINPTADPSNDTHMRFVFENDSKKIEMQEFQSGNWETLLTFEGIEKFQLCDDASMIASTATCPLPNSEINARHVANLNAPEGSTPSNRFFRYQVNGKANLSGGANSVTFQGAFFVRHPLPSTNVSFRWHMRD